MSVLEVKNLTHTYDGNTPFVNDAVKDVSFAAEKGEIIGIIGHTGSGKSTLVQHLNGLLKPTSGEILVDNKNIWENPKEIRKIRSKVGLVFQYPEYQLFEESVEKDVAFGVKNMGIGEEEALERAHEAMALVGLAPEKFAAKSPFELSGGMKRRVSIARALAAKADVYIMDEPFKGLDPETRSAVFGVIRRRTEDALLIMVTHDPTDAECADMRIDL